MGYQDAEYIHTSFPCEFYLFSCTKLCLNFIFLFQSGEPWNTFSTETKQKTTFFIQNNQTQMAWIQYSEFVGKRYLLCIAASEDILLYDSIKLWSHSLHKWKSNIFFLWKKRQSWFSISNVFLSFLALFRFTRK